MTAAGACWAGQGAEASLRETLLRMEQPLRGHRLPLLFHGESLMGKDHGGLNLTTVGEGNCTVFGDHHAACFRGIPARFKILSNNLNNLILFSLVRQYLNASTH